MLGMIRPTSCYSWICFPLSCCPLSPSLPQLFFSVCSRQCDLQDQAGNTAIHTPLTDKVSPKETVQTQFLDVSEMLWGLGRLLAPEQRADIHMDDSVKLQPQQHSMLSADLRRRNLICILFSEISISTSVSLGVVQIFMLTSVFFFVLCFFNENISVLMNEHIKLWRELRVVAISAGPGGVGVRSV